MDSLPYIFDEPGDIFVYGEPRIMRPDLTPATARQIMVNLCPSDWSTSKVEEIVVERHAKHSGLTNRHFMVSYGSKKVMIHLFGGICMTRCRYPEYLTDSLNAIVYQERSRLGQGPKLIGVQAGLRVDEYLEGHQLTIEEAPKYMNDFARCFGRYHSMDGDELGLDKVNYDKIFTLMDSYWDVFQKDHPFWIRPGMLKEYQLFRQLNIVGEKAWLDGLMSRLDPDHQKHRVTILYDVNMGNTIVLERPKPGYDLPVMLMDYECTMIGPRGHDLGGFMVQVMGDYKLGAFTMAQPFPSEETRREFAYHYLKEVKGSADASNVDKLVEEMSIGALLSLLSLSTFMGVAADDVDSFPQARRLVGMVMKDWINLYYALKKDFIKCHGWQ